MMIVNTMAGDAIGKMQNQTVAIGPDLSLKMKEIQKKEYPVDNNKVIRSQQFMHHFYRPAGMKDDSPIGELIVLFHGSGGNEESLVPMARRLWPNAVLLGLRGRVLQDGKTRWYRRLTPVTFDQQDIRLEANAFARFFSGLADRYDFDLSRTTFVGYSNGANLLAATMILHPDFIRRAILMRSMPVLNDSPVVDLSRVRILTLTGLHDTLYSPYAPALSELLRKCQAKIDAQTVNADHMLGMKDEEAIREWLAASNLDGTAGLGNPVRP